MRRYRKLAVVIDAVHWTGDNVEEVSAWAGGLDINASTALVIDDPTHGELTIVIATLEGKMTAAKGDWIIRGVKGELYPCKPDIFEATYEPELEQVDFAAGDIVRLKSGGPRMSVNKVERAVNVEMLDGSKKFEDHIFCVWFTPIASGWSGPTFQEFRTGLLVRAEAM